MRMWVMLFLFSIGRTFAYEYNDSHFHLTNYIQEGITAKDFLKIMGDRTGRSTLFGIPLQQQWSDRISGPHAPKYYLDTDARLYYYSFTDASIAMAYNSLTPEEKKRFDPMITGFNPTDMYAVDHIKRVLKTFPGVFVGIGEFTIHKEFVSSKIAGDIASLTDKALDNILKFAEEVGMVVIIHTDLHAPFQKEDADPVFFTQIKNLFSRHPNATIIWAHTGLGRIIQPFSDHAQALERILKDKRFKNIYFDISWDEVAKYIAADIEVAKRAGKFLEKYPDRFLFGSDEVAPKDAGKYYRIHHMYETLWKYMKPEVAVKVKRTNYERLFDKARKDVREWEKKNL